MIIVEGMDNSGKTQLSAHLAEKFDLKIIKRSGPPKDRASFVIDTIESLVLNPEVIFDRHPIISEGVYGPLLRGVNVFESEATTWEFYIDRLVVNNPLLIYCRPPDEKILSFGSRSQMGGVIDNARRLITGYDKMMKKVEERGLPIIRYDFTSLCAELMVDYAVQAYLQIKGEL